MAVARPPVRPAESGLEWLARFERENGRPLRVLHIGNIANNAYNNAKIQRQRGIEADVSCHDYYHVMGCPEWEDAEFEGEIADAFFPDWWKLDLHGFRRPAWFAQGRQRTCQRYLLAVRRREDIRARLLWRQLRFELWLRCRSTRAARTTALLAGLARGRALPTDHLRYALLYLSSVTRTAVRKTRALGRALVALARGTHWRTAALMVFPRRLAFLAVGPQQIEVARRAAALPAGKALSRIEEMPSDPVLVRRFRELFPGREPLAPDDYAGYALAATGWAPVLEEYDVVQAYSTDPIVPVLCGYERFAAYEHGTLREIPFEVTAQGRLCALAYREAPVVFVTNSDVVPPARRLGLRDDQMVFLPHAVDSLRLFTFADAHTHLIPAAGDAITFFSPSRHDWVDGDPSWAKGNDRVIRALGIVRDRGLPAQLVLTDWGRDLAATRRLIDELGLADRVSWTPTQRKRDLWGRYLSAHAVIDQFVVPAIGGVTFEAMALGRRVITSVDEPAATDFFGAPPAVLDCSDPEGIADAMASVVADPLDERGRGQAARDWFTRYHSADRIVELQASAYRRLLEAS